MMPILLALDLKNRFPMIVSLPMLLVKLVENRRSAVLQLRLQVDMVDIELLLGVLGLLPAAQGAVKNLMNLKMIELRQDFVSRMRLAAAGAMRLGMEQPLELEAVDLPA